MFGIPEWAIGIGFIVLAVSIGRAVMGLVLPADRLGRGRPSRRALGQTLHDLPARLGEIEEMQQKLGELEELQRRVAEVEERLDFAERLLTKQRDAERLASPKQ